MASLIEVTEWVEELYQLEQEDLVLGGADGIDNLQAKQLGARTRWLKQQIEAAVTDATAHIEAADPHPQYATEGWVTGLFNDLTNGAPTALNQLNEFAAALGNDANFSATILAQLALKAPLDSPELTGTPTCPTPPQFYVGNKLINAAFLKQAGLQVCGVTIKNAGGGYAAALADIGGVIHLASGYSGTLILPALTGNTIPVGSCITIGNWSGADVTVQRGNAADSIWLDASGGIGSFTLKSGTRITFYSFSASGWMAMSGDGALTQSSGAFLASLSSNGYQKLPSGIIIQWGSVITAADGTASWVFPIAFPSNVYSVNATVYQVASTATATVSGTPSISNAGIKLSVAQAFNVFCMAIGQ